MTANPNRITIYMTPEYRVKLDAITAATGVKATELLRQTIDREYKKLAKQAQENADGE